MRKKINSIAVSAMFVALAFALSNFRLFKMPFGGSVTAFSMLTISIPGYLFGFPIAIISSIVYGLLQLAFGGYIYTIPQVILDYILAFGSFAVVGLVKDKNINFLLIGFTVACILRLIFSTISGVVFFAEYAPDSMNPVVYSLLYNGAYIFAEMLLSYIIILLPITSNLLSKIKYYI